MTIAEIKEKIKKSTKISEVLKEQLLNKVNYLKMPELQKLAAALSWQEDEKAFTGKLAQAFSAMNNYATKKGTKSVYQFRENKQTEKDKEQEEALLKQLDNL